jgi:integrase
MKTWTLSRDDLMTVPEWCQLRRHLRERAELAERRRTRTAIVNEAVIMTVVGTGLRRAELAALDVGDLRLKNELPYLVVKSGKGSKHREVPMSPRLRAFLKRFLRWKATWGEPVEAGSPLFAGQRGRLKGSGINRLFKRACIEAGVRPLHVHAARHFMGTNLDGMAAYDKILAGVIPTPMKAPLKIASRRMVPA